MLPSSVEFHLLISDSQQSGERYEMRVLGLLRDAWLTSEKRRWQEGGHQVEWFVFGDDDTWWSDIRLVRSLLEGYNPNEDHYLGSFSEARANLADNSRIAFGGAGIIVSRSLVRKMQPMSELLCRVLRATSELIIDAEQSTAALLGSPTFGEETDSSCVAYISLVASLTTTTLTVPLCRLDHADSPRACRFRGARSEADGHPRRRQRLPCEWSCPVPLPAVSSKLGAERTTH